MGQRPELELLVTPDFTWRRIDKCTTGRVYLLECKSADREFFFWMQEPEEEGDSELEEKVKKAIRGELRRDPLEFDPSVFGLSGSGDGL